MSLAQTSLNKAPSPPKRDTIQVMSDAFTPDELRNLIDFLQNDDQLCSTFVGLEGIAGAYADPCTKILILGTSDERLSFLIKTIQGNADKAPHIPILVYLRQHLHGGKEEELPPEIDDFFTEPLNLPDVRLRIRFLDKQLADKLNEIDQAKLNLISQFAMQQIVGKSAAFLTTVEKIPRIAGCDAPVLLIGDTGTGKEMCARAIHYLSPRANKPFIPVNCGAIPVELFENEMFGHESGAYTDARKASRGLIAEAEGGTLFLDEVDSLPLPAQVKLLRFLQDRQYRPLGAANYRHANTRLIAASNQNLQARVRERTFREDFYYRLKVVSLSLPALWQRPEDVLLLANHFLKTAAEEYHSPVRRFSASADEKLLAYSWPGNVRELENVVRQAVVLAEGTVIYERDLAVNCDASTPAVARTKESFKAAKARAIETFERKFLQELLSSCGGNISKAAREAKKDRRAFFELLKKYDLTKSQPGQLSYN
jgi:DNA-binding NtrC family response regulator